MNMTYLKLSIITEAKGVFKSKKFILKSFYLFGITYNSNMHNLLDIVSLTLKNKY